MGILDKLLGGLFGGGGKSASATKGDSDGMAIFYFIECDKCGEVVRVRLDRRWDFEQQFNSSGDSVSGYHSHKEAMGKNCFKMIMLDVDLDGRQNLIDAKIKGGKFVTRAEYEEFLKKPPVLPNTRPDPNRSDRESEEIDESERSNQA